MSSTGGPLPPGWQEYSDDDTGALYYHNATTGETTWERPVGPVVVSPPPVPPVPASAATSSSSSGIKVTIPSIPESSPSQRYFSPQPGSRSLLPPPIQTSQLGTTPDVTPDVSPLGARSFGADSELLLPLSRSDGSGGVKKVDPADRASFGGDGELLLPSSDGGGGGAGGKKIDKSKLGKFESLLRPKKSDASSPVVSPSPSMQSLNSPSNSTTNLLAMKSPSPQSATSTSTPPIPPSSTSPSVTPPRITTTVAPAVRPGEPSVYTMPADERARDESITTGPEHEGGHTVTMPERLPYMDDTRAASVIRFSVSGGSTRVMQEPYSEPVSIPVPYDPTPQSAGGSVITDQRSQNAAAKRDKQQQKEREKEQEREREKAKRLQKEKEKQRDKERERERERERDRQQRERDARSSRGVGEVSLSTAAAAGTEGKIERDPESGAKPKSVDDDDEPINNDEGFQSDDEKPSAEQQAGTEGATQNAAAKDAKDNWKETGHCATMAMRTLVACCAVIFLWCTSLSIATSISQIFIYSPATSEIIRAWEITIDVTRAEKAGFGRCAKDQIKQCNDILNRTTYSMIDDVNRAKLYNADLVNRVQTAAVACSQAAVNTYDALRRWNALDQVLNQVKYYNICTAEQTNYISSTLGDLGQVQSGAYILSKNYARDMQSFSASASESVGNYTLYNKNYVLDKTGRIQLKAVQLGNLSLPHIGNLMAQLNWTFSINQYTNCLIGERNTSCPQDTIVQQYKELVTALNTSYFNLRNDFQYNYDATVDFMTRVANKMVEIADFMASVAAILVYIPPGIPLPGFPSLGGVGAPTLQAMPLPYFILPIGPFFNASFPNIGLRFNASMEAIRANVNLQAVQWSTDINVTIGDMPTLLDDYNPPPVELQNDKADAATDSYLAQQRTQLNQKSTATDTVTQVNATLTQPVNVLNNIDLSSNYTFSFAAFDSDFSLKSFILALNELGYYLLLLDYLYRAWMTIRLFVKYYTASAIGLPEVDIRNFKNNKPSENMKVTLMRIWTDRRTMYVFLFFIGCIGVWAVMNQYVPLYQSYEEGCVKTRSGSIISRNVYSFAYNMASSDGNEDLSKGLEKYNAQRGQSCGLYAQDSTTTYNAQANDLNSAAKTWETARLQLFLFQSCVNTTVLPDAATFLDTVQMTSPIVTLAANQQCLQPFTTEQLVPAIFNCSLLPKCVTTCNGPNAENINGVTLVSGCRSESLFHSIVFRALCALLVFICMNVSRLLAMAGISRLFWRSITPYGLVYKASVSRSGKPSKKHDKKLKKKTLRTIATFEWTATLFILLAILAHLPYIIVLVSIPNPVPS